MWQKYLQQKSLQQTRLWQETAYNKHSTRRHVCLTLNYNSVLIHPGPSLLTDILES